MAGLSRVSALLVASSLVASAQDDPRDRAPAGEAGLRVLFSRLDRDGDGKITKADLEGAGRKTGWFDNADSDGDAFLDLGEAKAFLSGRASPVAEPDAGPSEFVRAWPEVSPVSLEAARSAADYSAARNGHAILVAVRGRTIYERYDNGWDPERGHRLASGTKSFSGAILAAAVKDGLLEVDEPVSATITAWKTDEQLAAVTIRDLLGLTSGIEPGANGKVPSYADAVSVKAVSGRGEKFRYGPAAFQVFGELVRRKLEAQPGLEFPDPLAYLEDRVFDPIGLEHVQWRRDEDGMPHLPSGAFITAREWVKFGEFLRERGAAGGRQLVDAATLAACLEGSEANPGYGLTFWLLDDGPRADASEWRDGAYMAAGAGKQRLYILPRPGVVVVRFGESRRFEDAGFLGELFGDGES